MANILGMEIGDVGIGGGDGLFGGGGLSIPWVLIAVIFMIFLIAAIVIYMVFQWRIWNKRIIVFENISGQGYQPILKDRARTVRLGDAGEEILYLKKKRVYRSAYGRKMGKNTYWFAVGQDGYWYNIVLGDLDAKMGMLDIEPIDRDMRYMHVAVRKNIQERYRKTSFMEKYGSMIMMAVFLVIVIIGIIMLVKRIGEAASSTNAAIESAGRVMEAAENVIASLDNICTGGSGITPAPVEEAIT